MFDLFKFDGTKLARLHTELNREFSRRSPQRDPGHQIKGQEAAKRAVLVAACGGHSLLLAGPSGCGKSLLRALAAELSLHCTFEALSCKCGRHGDPRQACMCTARQLGAVTRKFPQCDMTFGVAPVPARELSSKLVGTGIDDMREQVERAEIHESLNVDEAGGMLLRNAVSEIGLSAATRQTVLQVARTIANLDCSETIQSSHIAEAVNYRPLG